MLLCMCKNKVSVEKGGDIEYCRMELFYVVLCMQSVSKSPNLWMLLTSCTTALWIVTSQHNLTSITVNLLTVLPILLFSQFFFNIVVSVILFKSYIFCQKPSTGKLYTLKCLKWWVLCSVNCTSKKAIVK